MPVWIRHAIVSLAALFAISVPAHAEELSIGCTIAHGPTNVGVGYGTLCMAFGDIRPIQWSIKGELPSGFIVASDTRAIQILGTPRSAADYHYAIQVTDASNRTATVSFTGTVPSCGPSYVPSSASVVASNGPSGGGGSLAFQFGDFGCSWEVASDVPWVTFITPTSGITAPRTVSVAFSVAPNPDPIPRHGNLTLKEDGVPVAVVPIVVNSDTCTYSVGDYSAELSPMGENKVVRVTADPSDCVVNATADSWINVWGSVLKSPGTPGPWSYGAMANRSGAARSGTIRFGSAPGVTSGPNATLPVFQGTPDGSFNIGCYLDYLPLVGGNFSLGCAYTGGTPPLDWSSSGLLPRGLLNRLTGFISSVSGRPTMAESYHITVTANDSSSPPKTASITLDGMVFPNVLKPNCTSLAGPAQTRSPYGISCLPDGGTPPYRWSIVAGDLPPGLSITSIPGNGITITGIPESDGEYAYTLELIDSADSPATAALPFRGTILPDSGSPLPFSMACTRPNPPFYDSYLRGDVPMSAAVVCSASGGVPPIRWGFGRRTPFIFEDRDCPECEVGIPGMDFDKRIGTAVVVGGTPTPGGPFSWAVRAYDSSPTPQNRIRTFLDQVRGKLDVSCFGYNDGSIADGPSVLRTDVIVGMPGTYDVRCYAGGGISNATLTLSGSLPSGLTLTSEGSAIRIIGVPNTPGPYSYSLSATDSSVPDRQTATLTFSGVIRPAGDTSCTYAVDVTKVRVDSAGGRFDIHVATGSSCPWIVGGIPEWIALSSAPDQSGSGTVTLNVAANPGVARSRSLKIAGTLVQFDQAGSNCNYAISHGGQTFSEAGGSGRIELKTMSFCPWKAETTVSWILLTSPSSSTGNGTVTYEVISNSGLEARTGTIFVAGNNFKVEQARPSTNFADGGSMPQIAWGGGWTTSLEYANLGAAPAQAQVNLFDDRGEPALLPFKMSLFQATAGPMLASTRQRTILPRASFRFESSGADTGPVQGAWSQLLTDGDLDGFETISNTPSKLRTIVPLETRHSGRYWLIFDNTNAAATGVAITNLIPQPAKVNITLFDETGARIGVSSVDLPARGHTAFYLATKYSMVAGKRGTMEFETAPEGKISLVGLRFGRNTLTWIPVLAEAGSPGGSFATIMFNTDWKTIFTLVNLGESPAPVTLSFFDRFGGPLNVPLLLTQTGQTLTTTTLTRTVPPGATLIIETLGNSPSLVSGSTQLSTTGNLNGLVTFRATSSGDEPTMPLETRNAGSYWMPFDNTGDLGAAFALANISAEPVTVIVNIRDDSGVSLNREFFDLPGRGSMSFFQRSIGTAGRRGTVEVTAPTGSQVSVMGLQFSNGRPMAIPVFAR